MGAGESALGLHATASCYDRPWWSGVFFWLYGLTKMVGQRYRAGLLGMEVLVLCAQSS